MLTKFSTLIHCILISYDFFYRLLLKNVINKPRKLFSTTVYDITYPSSGFSNYTITYIKVIDLKTDDTGGFPYLNTGGIGYHNTVINLISRRNHGLNFNVSIYGR